ncbi:MAG: peptide chain release factor N(5)-glutamine methyltransferase [Caulobacterales bacterium]
MVSAWTAATRRLAAAGVDSPAIDARLLLEAAAEVARAEILADPHRPLAPETAERLATLVERRAGREPVSHILGKRGFWTIMLRVSGDVLTPRPDTETLVEVVLGRFAPDQAFSLLDLGVGSGAILLAILAERPNAAGLGVDASPAALAVAQENAAILGLTDRAALQHGDWAAGLADASFDVVVANPPYIASAEIETLEPEVRDFEPRLALDGGADGLDAYRILAPEMLRALKPGGLFAVEIGAGQREAVLALFRAAGGEGLSTYKDLADRDRVVAGAKKPLGNHRLNR